MTKAKRFVFIALIAALALLPLGAVNPPPYSDHAKQVGMKLKCMCRGCDMSAGGCSHPGGAFSGPCETAKGMLQEVDRHIASGESDEQIVQAFVNQYGSVVRIEPPKSGFGLIAWILPFFYTILGLALVVFILRKWRAQHAVNAAAAAQATPGIPSEALERARAQAARETED